VHLLWLVGAHCEVQRDSLPPVQHNPRSRQVYLSLYEGSQQHWCKTLHIPLKQQ